MQTHLKGLKGTKSKSLWQVRVSNQGRWFLIHALSDKVGYLQSACVLRKTEQNSKTSSLALVRSGPHHVLCSSNSHRCAREGCGAREAASGEGGAWGVWVAQYCPGRPSSAPKGTGRSRDVTSPHCSQGRGTGFPRRQLTGHSMLAFLWPMASIWDSVSGLGTEKRQAQLFLRDLPDQTYTPRVHCSPTS